MFKRTFLLFLFISILFILTLSSSEWARCRLLEYYLNEEDYQSAMEVARKMIVKRKAINSLNENLIHRISTLLETAYIKNTEHAIKCARERWETSKRFFDVIQIANEKIILPFKDYDVLSGHILLKDTNLWKQLEKLILSLKSYTFITGFSDNDVSPESGPLTFGHTGSVALDCRLRSIGANLGEKKPVAGIRLRRWQKETRVKPDNLSLWISDDNKSYRRYAGQIHFSTEDRAITIDRLDITCRFLKVHCDFKDDQYTFAENFKNILEIFGPPAF